MRAVSSLLLALGAATAVGAASLIAVAIAAAVANPFPNVPQDVNENAPLLALVATAVATSFICGGLLLRRPPNQLP